MKLLFAVLSLLPQNQSDYILYEGENILPTHVNTTLVKPVTNGDLNLTLEYSLDGEQYETVHPGITINGEFIKYRVVESFEEEYTIAIDELCFFEGEYLDEIDNCEGEVVEVHRTGIRNNIKTLWESTDLIIQNNKVTQVEIPIIENNNISGESIINYGGWVLGIISLIMLVIISRRKKSV